MAFAGWLSPTSAWRLVQCRAAVPGVAGSGQSQGNHQLAADAGSLAHEALRHWVTAGCWRSDTVGQLLQESFDAAAEKARVDVTAVPRGVLMRAQLASMASVVRSAMEGADLNEVASEVELEDAEQRLQGRADLIVNGHRPAVLDLKTGKLSAGQVPEAARFQLLMYAHMFRVAHGALPERLELLSVAHGRVDVPFTEADVDGVLATVIRAREEAGGAPTPGTDKCHYCPRRLSCDAHWLLPEDERPDSLEGQVAETSTAATGVLGIRLRTEPETWVTQLQPNQVPAGLSAGDRVRIVGLTRARASTSSRRATRDARVTALR